MTFEDQNAIGEAWLVRLVINHLNRFRLAGIDVKKTTFEQRRDIAKGVLDHVEEKLRTRTPNGPKA